MRSRKASWLFVMRTPVEGTMLPCPMPVESEAHVAGFDCRALNGVRCDVGAARP